MASESMITTGMMDDEFEDENIRLLVEKKEWMKECTFKLVTDVDELARFVDEAIANGHCAVDTETTGLSTRLNPEGKPVNKIVGFCLAYSKNYGIYVPVYHTEKKAVNMPLAPCIDQVRRLVENCVTLYANFKFDGEFLRNNGIVIEDWKKVLDVQLMHYVLYAHHKARGLKLLSKNMLNREMIEIEELFASKGRIAFHTLSPRMALDYAASDAVNTYGLWEMLAQEFKEADPGRKNGTYAILDIERRCQIVVMEMERNYCKINRAYYEELRGKVIKELAAAKELIYQEAGEVFDVASPLQLGRILFEKLKIKYPSDERSATGGWLTGEEILDKIKDVPAIKAILKHRELEKILGTYIENLLLNADWNDEVKFSMKQASADTGRFSATGGDGLEMDGYSGVNCQNIPAAPKDPKAINIRKGIVAHEGYQLCSIDFSGEELRIATNLSREKTWIQEFIHGEGDLHAVSAANIYHSTPEEMRKPENKTKRGVGKSANFLTLYGGGPGRLAEVAKVTMDEAKVLLENFFAGVPGLQSWLNKEGVAAMKRGYAATAFGRRRDLRDFFKDPNDKKMVSAGKRRANNSQIQGTGADIIKIALYRTWRYIRNGGYENEVKIIMPIHDEIVFEIRTDCLHKHIPNLVNVMKMDDILKDQLHWEVGLECDAEYGDDFCVKHNYFDELKEAAKAAGLETPAAPPPEASASSSLVAEDAIVSDDDGGGNESPTFEYTEQKERAKPSEDGVLLFANDDASPFFDYEVQKSDEVAKKQTDLIWALLEHLESKNLVTGKKKRIRLIRDSVVVHKTFADYSVDGFVVLALLFQA